MKTLEGKTMKQNRPRLQIIRGLPGSGKTTLALKMYPHLLRLETDMFFYSQGAYRFTLLRNDLAVEWFMKEVDLLCKGMVDFVATGVFAAHTERLQETIARALKYKYDVYIKTLTTQFKGIHAVPKEHFDAMKASFISDEALRQIYPSWGFPNIHFGLMGKGMTLAHIKKSTGSRQDSK